MDSYSRSFKAKSFKSSSLKSSLFKSQWSLPRPPVAEAAPSLSLVRSSSCPTDDFPAPIVERHSTVAICMLSILLLVGGSLAFPYLISASRTFGHPVDSALRSPADLPILPPAAHRAPAYPAQQDLDSAQSFQPLALVAALLFLVLAMLDKINEKFNDKFNETRIDETPIHETTGSLVYGAIAFAEPVRPLRPAILSRRVACSRSWRGSITMRFF